MKILKGHYYIKFDFLYMNIYNNNQIKCVRNGAICKCFI